MWTSYTNETDLLLSDRMKTNERKEKKNKESMLLTMRQTSTLRTSLPSLSPLPCKPLANCILRTKQTGSESLVMALRSNSIVKCDMNYYYIGVARKVFHRHLETSSANAITLSHTQTGTANAGARNAAGCRARSLFILSLLLFVDGKTNDCEKNIV